VICEKLEQPWPWQRSTKYSVTPTLSVEADQVRLICVNPTADAVKSAGAEGAVVSPVGTPVLSADLGASGCLKQLTSRNAASRNPWRSSTRGFTATTSLTLPSLPQELSGPTLKTRQNLRQIFLRTD